MCSPTKAALIFQEIFDLDKQIPDLQNECWTGLFDLGRLT